MKTIKIMNLNHSTNCIIPARKQTLLLSAILPHVLKQAVAKTVPSHVTPRHLDSYRVEQIS
jgi:hypothetical protein